MRCPMTSPSSRPNYCLPSFGRSRLLTPPLARCYTERERGSEVFGLALLAGVEAFVERHSLLQSGDRVLVAVSGGPDSVALLHVLTRMCTDWQLTLHVTHVDHGLRADARGDAAFVKQMGTAWGVPVSVAHVDVRGERRGGESTQQAARRLRLAALRQTAADVEANRIALGHHRDDQAETVLLRLLRGSGMTGLGGMRPKRGPFIRPLLDSSRADIERYCAAHQLDVVHDASNESELYARNRVRRRLLPLLQSEYNPNVLERLARTAELLQADDALLESMAAKVYERARKTGARNVLDGGDADGRRAIVLSARVIEKQPAALRRRIVRRGLQAAGVDLRRVTYEHTDAVVALVSDASAGALTLPGDLRVERDGDDLVFGGGGDAAEALTALRKDVSRASGAVVLSEPPARRELHIPGRTTLAPGIALEATFTPAESAPRDGAVVLTEAAFDRDALHLPLFIRFRKPGDRLRPVGLGGTKKLQDLFVDEKVPRHLRDRVPIIEDSAGIVWIPGLRMDERAAADNRSQHVLHMRITSL